MRLNVMNKLVLIGLAGIIVACRPAQKDPPIDWDRTRRDTSVKDVKIAPDHPLAIIGAPELWKKTTGKNPDGSRVKIAVVGTGVDYTNPDLRDALYLNLGELSETTRYNNMDDDGNEYPDDVFGFDFYSGDGQPYDWHGHDTFIAGIIAATGQKNKEIIGVAPNAELIIARYLGSDGRREQTTGMDAAEAVFYSIKAGAKVIYFNWPEGGFGEAETPILLEVFKMAADANILIVTPAGNSSNQDVPHFLKEAAKMPNVIVVAGLDTLGRIAPGSNSGKFLTSVAAPSMGTVSYLPGQIVSKDIRTTSVAAAYVTGAAALISTLPGMGSVEKVKGALLNTAVSKALPEPIEVLADGALYLGGL